MLNVSCQLGFTTSLFYHVSLFWRKLTGRKPPSSPVIKVNEFVIPEPREATHLSRPSSMSSFKSNKRALSVMFDETDTEIYHTWSKGSLN